MKLCHPWYSWWWPNLPSVLCQLHLTFDQNINVGGIYIFIVKDWKVLIAFLMRLLIFRLGHCGTISFPGEETSHCTLLDQTGDRGRFGWVGAKIQCIWYPHISSWNDGAWKCLKSAFHFPSPLNIRGGPAFVPGGRSLNIYGVYYTVAPNPVSYNTLQYFNNGVYILRHRTQPNPMLGVLQKLAGK